MGGDATALSCLDPDLGNEARACKWFEISQLDVELKLVNK